jgi:succinyl-diaminopimelate desuccinylase
VADEETGSEKGIEYVLQHRNPFKKEDLILVPDAGNSSGTMIDVAEKSILWQTYRTIGRQAHGSTPGKGINSFRAAAHLIVEFNKLYEMFPERDDLFDPPISTFEPTKKEENVPNINTIPGEDVFSMDMRILPVYPLEDIKKSIREMTHKIEDRFEVRIHIETVRIAPAAPPTPADAPIVRALQKAVKAAYMAEAKPMGSGGGTMAAAFRRNGYNAACWSRSDETSHQPNEYCIIDNMVGTAKVFAHLFLQEGP